MQVKFGSKTYFKTKFSDLLGKTVVSFVEEGEAPLCSSLCRGDGMTIKFEREICTLKEAEDFLSELRGLLGSSWEEREKLRPKLSTNLAGH